MSDTANNIETRPPTEEPHVTPIFSEEAMIRTCPQVYAPLLGNSDRHRSHCVVTATGDVPVFRKYAGASEREAYSHIPEAVRPYICTPLDTTESYMDFPYIPSGPSTTVSFTPFETEISGRQEDLITALVDFEFACQNQSDNTYFLHGDFAAHNVFFDESARLRVYDLEKTQIVDLETGKYKNFADFISRLWFAPEFQLQAIQHLRAQIDDPTLQHTLVCTLRDAVAKKRARTVDYYDSASDVAAHFIDARAHALANLYALLENDALTLKTLFS